MSVWEVLEHAGDCADLAECYHCKMYQFGALKTRQWLDNMPSLFEEVRDTDNFITSRKGLLDVCQPHQIHSNLE
ncbi:unnamed protein product [Periconia digitata]|uniref:Uncharacterized protein n=1 Tax=Periconia digitata TaxID=1303443 RepID=A0A9W4UGN7_9PLEO|nr:unnamed protein product [Periconia digitata]